MKKIKGAIIICVIIVLAILIAILGLSFKIKKRQEILDYINFESANYKSIGGVVFYENDIKLNAELEENFKIIANQLKIQYPGKSIIYLRNLGSADMFDAKELYRCMQISNGQKIDDTEMNVLIYENDNVQFQLLIGDSWKNVSTDEIQITQQQAEKITIEYLTENLDDYEELRMGDYYTSIMNKEERNIETCTSTLYYYNSKKCWKMQFETGNSYIIIDANTGEILNTNFFSGINID